MNQMSSIFSVSDLLIVFTLMLKCNLRKFCILIHRFSQGWPKTDGLSDPSADAPSAWTAWTADEHFFKFMDEIGRRTSIF